MREVIYVERSTEMKDGKTILSERKCHGLLEPDGNIRLLACCGKRFPIVGDRSQETKPIAKMNKRAA